MDLWRLLLWAYVALFSSYSIVIVGMAFCRPARTKLSDSSASLGIVLPAYNEMAHVSFIKAAIETAAAISVPIVIVDDGTVDGSEEIIASFARNDKVTVIRHQRNRGKAAALNTGIAALKTDLVLTLDADTTLNRENIPTAAAYFSSARTGAVAITIEGAQQSSVTRAQAAEYRYVLNFERLALSYLGIVFTVPGSASIWRKTALEDIGGFQGRTCAEDTDATLALSLRGWNVKVAASTLALTECPRSFAGLLQQRSRWIWGTIQAACFALIALTTQRVSHHRLTALAFVFVTALNVFGFMFTPIVLSRIILMKLGWSDLVAGALLVLITLARLTIVLWKEERSISNIFYVLVQLFTMQIANSVAFWQGLLSGRATNVSWQ